MDDIQREFSDEAIWKDQNKNISLNKELNSLTKITDSIRSVKDECNSLIDLVDTSSLEELNEINSLIEPLREKVLTIKNESLLNGPYDKDNCYLEIHPGAGGTEAMDWADMLLRMYTRFCEKNNFKYKLIYKQSGEEAGIKNAILLITGDNAYGYLKREKGIHRLVRISPFDSNSRRHTSFASVLVTPDIDTQLNIDIKESDIKMDVYHSSGAGGQSVNTSNSAVRLTHIPTGIVVSCQIERSQIQNRAVAMKMLKNKLYQLEKSNQEKEMKNLQGNMDNIDFGYQIRNYVLEPYKLVKDLRSEYETSNVDDVLDGNLMPIIHSLLERGIE